jgi:AhpD family alkylhydroperoxidase
MTTHTMKIATVTLALVSAAAAQARADRGPDADAAQAARADIQKTLGFGPQFLLKMPDAALPGLWQEFKGLQLNPSTALAPKTKELLGLGVASQIPCRYCVYAHTAFARLDGASEQEVGEAVAMASLTRHWSTFLNGSQVDEGKFRGEIARIAEGARKAAQSGAKPPVRGNVADAAAAYAEMNAWLGFVPEFMKTFPESAIPGAWREFRDVQLSPATALSGKQKELVGLAVAAQVPCRYCIVAHTEFARLNGASDAEIKEAIGMASLTRNFSTMLNGLQIDEAQFRRDVDKLVKGAQEAARKSAQARR